jgi:GxxExxY protein
MDTDAALMREGDESILGEDGLLVQEGDAGYALMSAAFEVHNELGSGFLEEVYQRALAVVLKERGIAFVEQAPLEILFRGEPLGKRYYADFLVDGQIVIEVKAVKTLRPEHEAQLFNYLKATGHQLGYLINFHSHPKLEWFRFRL